MSTVIDELNSAAEELERIVAQFNAIVETPIPTSLQDAVEKKWSLAEDIFGLGVLFEYSLEEQARDRTRVVSFRRAREALASMEEELVNTLIEDPIDLAMEFPHVVSNISGYVHTNWRQMLETYSNLISAQIAEEVREDEMAKVIIQFIALYLVRTTTVAVFARAVQSIAASHVTAEHQLRKYVLPQRHGKRYRRRKKSRL